MEELMAIGESIFNLKRMYNVKLGVNRKDDTIPNRLLTPKKEGAAAGSSPDMERLLDEYYRIRGWTEDGVPALVD
jgi:aldehyde:ferredoxin oxidoreductase